MFRCTVYRSHTSMSLITYSLFEKWLGIAIMKAMPQSRQKRIYSRPIIMNTALIQIHFEKIRMPISLYVYNINTILNEKLFQLTYLQESGIFADTGSLNSTMILRSPPRWCNIPWLNVGSSCQTRHMFNITLATSDTRHKYWWLTWSCWQVHFSGVYCMLSFYSLSRYQLIWS